jgi:hypothetical protein
MAVTPIIQILPTDPRWISLLESGVRIGIFHHPAWSQLLAECYGYRPFVIALPGANDTLKTGIPFMEINSPITGKRWVSLPFSDYCFPVYTDESALRNLVQEIIPFAKSKKINNIELRGLYPEQPALHTCSRYVIHEIDIRPGAEKVWKTVHEMHRRNTKIAKENGVNIIQGTTLEHLENFYDLHLLTRRRQGVPVQPWKFFNYMKKMLFDHGHGFLLLAYRDGKCLAGAVFLHYKEVLTYKYGASREDSLKYRPNDLVMWTAIERACDHSFTRFDLGRTDLENIGLRNFKSRWGAKENPLFYTNLGTRSGRSEDDRLVHYMQIILSKSPTWVCRLSGELLYKHFG